jgi:aminoglycoside phosphotransferase (APT) family kinase protein
MADDGCNFKGWHYTVSEYTPFQQLAERFEPGSTLVRAWPLKGGVSADVTALELKKPDGQIEKVIVRQHGAVDLQQNPQIAADEYRLLQIAHSAGLAVPKPYYVDQSGELFPTPVLVIEYIEGTAAIGAASIADATQQLAAHLAMIHCMDTIADLSFLPEQELRCTARLRERMASEVQTPIEQRILDVLGSSWPAPQRNRTALLHGDYWPGNTLWRDGSLVAIIDWEDAAIGDPLADLANSRLELLWAYGADAMEQYTRRYQSLASVDLTNLPYWELCAALKPAAAIPSWNLEPDTEQSMLESLGWFVGKAIERIST